MSISVKKSLKDGANSIKGSLNNITSTIKSTIKSTTKTNNNSTSLKNSIKSVSNISNNLTKNNISYLGVIFIIVLTIGYFVNKHYNAIIFLYLIGAISYLLTKNVFYSLLISIVLTNFLLSINFFIDSNKEGLTSKTKKKDKKEGLGSLKSLKKTLEKIKKKE